MGSETTASGIPEEPTETTVVASAPAPKPLGRPKKGSRPKIDIDDEIQEANRLAEVTKRMMQAAKAAQRNSRRTKQRLVRKAGKLSAADLERIATLKRCGLFVADPADPSTSSASSVTSSSSSSAAPPADPARRVNSKLFSAVGQVQGAADLLATMQKHVPASSLSVALAAAGAASGVESAADGRCLPRASRLSHHVSRATTLPMLPAPTPPETAPSPEPEGEQDLAEEEDGDATM